jgi:hypothetical protein
VCLEHHPDKKLAGVTDEAEKTKVEEYFKQVRSANDRAPTNIHKPGITHSTMS